MILFELSSSKAPPRITHLFQGQGQSETGKENQEVQQKGTC
jgi:hypothetical protein